MTGRPRPASLATVAALLWGALGLIGCSPSPSTSQVVAQSPVAHATVPTPFLTPSAPSPIDDGGSFAATGLWAVAGSQLLLSMDRGDTWVQRTLVPGVSLDAASADVLSNVFILDATHLWTANPGPDSTVPYEGQGPGFDHLHVVVSRSTDGGATWQSVNIPGDWGGTQPVLAFANDQDGFLLLAGLRFGPGSTVFATVDGGAAWEQVGDASDLGSILSASDPTTLWAGNQGDAGPVSRPILDVSRDGGRTWADASLPGLAGDIYVNDTLVEPPTFVGDDGAVAVYAGSTDNPPDIRFYGTRDVGRTWRLTSTFVPGGEDLPTVTVVDPRHFVAIDPISNSVQTSSDEGASWRESASSGLRAPLRLRFWDALHGAAIVQLANGAAPAVGLLRTDDGGVTWIPVAVKSGA